MTRINGEETDAAGRTVADVTDRTLIVPCSTCRSTPMSGIYSPPDAGQRDDLVVPVQDRDIDGRPEERVPAAVKTLDL